MLKVLIAGNDLPAANRVREAVADAGYDVCGVACTAAEAVALGRAHRPQLAVVAMRLADGGLGADVVAQLREGGGLRVLYVGESLHQFNELAAGDACVAGPCSAEDLLCALSTVGRGRRP